MKTILFALMLALSASLYAQDRPAFVPACGPAQEKFEVALRDQAEPAPIENGKALIYVIQDDTAFDSTPRPTTRIGVDGNWIGATRSNSYLRAAIDPGEHHLCVRWQGFVAFRMGMKMAALHFTAEPGKSYYFRVRNWYTSNHSRAGGDIDFAALDTDEGQLLANQYSFSSSHPKK